MRNMIALLVLLSLCVTTSLSAQDAPVTETQWADEIEALGSEETAAVEAARAALVAQPKAALPALEEAFLELAKTPSPETFPTLLEIMSTFRAMGPDAVSAIPFMADCTSHVDKQALGTWREDGSGDAMVAYNSLWTAMRLAIGATGRTGIELLMDGAEADAKTEGGVPFRAVLYTMQPNGAESMAAVAEIAFSEEERLRDFGMHFARYAESGLGEALQTELVSDKPEEQRRCLMLLSHNAPHSIHALSELFRSPKDELRRLALIALIRRANRSLLDPASTEYHGYMTWHGPLHPTPERPFEIMKALRAKSAEGALAEALRHEDEVTRTLAAFLLMRTALPGAPVSEALLAAAEDSSPSVKYWAGEAVQRRQAIDLRWLEALRELPLDRGRETITEFSTRKRIALEAMRTDAQAFAQLDPASNCEEAIVRLEALVALLHESWPEESSRLETLESIRRRAMRAIVEQMDEDFGGDGEGHRALRSFGNAGAPEIEADYMKEPRFSVGPPTYEARASLIESLGMSALPLITQALFHWRESPRARFSRQALENLGDGAAAALPILRQVEVWDALVETL